MYLILVVVVYILFAWFFVDWKRWKEFYPTVQFFIICNLLYNFLFYHHTLWAYKAVTVDWLNHTLIELVFTFFIIPVVIMIFLRFFPSGKKTALYLLCWILYFTFLEFLFYKKGLFLYDHGWNLGWSAIFNVIMFSILGLHHKKPLLALLLSLPTIIILLYIFHPTFSELK
ncbi:CBO0543 family protein [Bacillus sp. KH172YL63]|uniref:CBO0543 family protein n=1 Tax=Bacillus sp. KH172YL63 TaxID=2709784 RepID=UPI0013E50D30|nr:CBO0543 family protein [Bacillus sp. KH172YL63]BCB02749.1 hypothetical protein KH172YL63_08820 [Bacillus sp. KH172YL63]